MSSLPYDPELYLDIRKYIEDHLDLVEEDEYDVLTAKVFESWHSLKLKEVGYVFFVGPPRSGKTRALEVLASLCFNSKMASYMSTATLYRMVDMEQCTVFFDEIQQYLQEDKMGFMALLNAGQRRGQKAWILVSVKGAWIPTGFSTFCPKFLASTRDTAEALATRCIIITMMKNVRIVPLRLDKDRAELLRDRLNKHSGKTMSKNLPDLEEEFLRLGFKDYRNIEAFINLAALTPPMYRDHIYDYAKAIDDQIAEEEGLTEYAELFAALEHAWSMAKGGKVSVHAVAEVYNDGRPENEVLMNRRIGSMLNIIGLRKKCRMTGGRVGRYVTERTMKRLRRRYGVRQTKIDEVTSEQSEDSEDSEASNGVGV